MAGIRETLYGEATPAATRRLRLVTSELGDVTGLRGAAVMVAERILSPDAIDRRFARTWPDDARETVHLMSGERRPRRACRAGIRSAFEGGPAQDVERPRRRGRRRARRRDVVARSFVARPAEEVVEPPRAPGEVGPRQVHHARVAGASASLTTTSVRCSSSVQHHASSCSQRRVVRPAGGRAQRPLAAAEVVGDGDEVEVEGAAAPRRPAPAVGGRGTRERGRASPRTGPRARASPPGRVAIDDRGRPLGGRGELGWRRGVRRGSRGSARGAAGSRGRRRGGRAPSPAPSWSRRS